MFRLLLGVGLILVSLLAAHRIAPMAAIAAQEDSIDDDTLQLTLPYLESLMPNGQFIKDPRTEISNNTSRSRYHPRMKINKAMDQYINKADSVFLYCMYDACLKPKHPKVTYKATQFKPKHWNKAHKDVELKADYFRIFSVWEVDYDARKYKKEYIQLKINDLTYYTPMTPPATPPVQQPEPESLWFDNEVPSDASDSATLIAMGAIDEDDEDTEAISSNEESNALLLDDADGNNGNNELLLFGNENKNMEQSDWNAMNFDDDFEMEENKKGSSLGKRAIHSPFKSFSNVLNVANDTKFDEISQKLDRILENQNKILENQQIIIQNNAKRGHLLQQKLNFSNESAVIVDIGPDFINPNYVNLRIKAKTLKQYANTPDGQRTVKIRKVYDKHDTYDFFCKACHRFGVPTNSEADENYRKGFALSQEQLDDPDEMRSKKPGLLKHFKHTEQHYRAELLFIEYKNGWKSGLLLKMDIYYHLALNPTNSMKSFEGHMVIIHNEKKRSKCDCVGCCAIGTKQNGKDMVTRWRKLTYEYLNMQLLFNISCLGSYKQNIVFLSVTMDGYDIGMCYMCFVCFCFAFASLSLCL